MLEGAFGTPTQWQEGRYFNLIETLVKATPLMLTGLSVAVAFRMRFWNIGAEGQLVMGGVAAAAVALWRPSFSPSCRKAAGSICPSSSSAAWSPGRHLGVDPGLPESVPESGRDHHHADVQLHRHPLLPIPVQHCLERPGRLWLSRHGLLPEFTWLPRITGGCIGASSSPLWRPSWSGSSWTAPAGATKSG
jgi:hypothetical protein